MSYISRFRRPIHLVGLSAAITLAVGLGFLVDPLPLLMTDVSAQECGSNRDGTICVFENAPVRLGSEPVQVAGKLNDHFSLLAEIRFLDAEGRTWTAPPGTLTDGAFIPNLFLPLFVDGQSPEYLSAAVLYDAHCGAGNAHLATYHARGWEETHRMLYDSLRANEVPETEAKILFAAVYLAGPRWNDPERALHRVPASDLLREMIWAIWFIEFSDPSRADIETWMKAREPHLLAGETLTAAAV